MDKTEAKALLEASLAVVRRRSYVELVSRLDRPLYEEGTTSSGKRYQIQVVVFWDDAPGGNIRVIGSIDDGGWRWFLPVTSDFIMSPDGSFVGE